MTGPIAAADTHQLEPEGREFYCRTLAVFAQAGIDLLIGGAYALGRYTGIERHTKDFDVFVRDTDFARTIQALADAGYRTETTFPHWLGKAFHGDYFIDVIHNSGNGVAVVDDEWFEHAVHDALFDIPVKLCPVEEMIWSKSFVQERERFDGADVAHLLLTCGPRLNWPRLLRRFGPDWPVLLAHLVLFGFIYPSERDRVPTWVLHDLMQRQASALSAPPPTERICRGTLLSRQQYLPDLLRWRFQDARRQPDNPMSDTDIETWTAGIARDGSR